MSLHFRKIICAIFDYYLIAQLSQKTAKVYFHTLIIHEIYLNKFINKIITKPLIISMDTAPTDGSTNIAVGEG